ncbi:MAG: efflux RND transporter periplasmic adaptor subunit [Proteobacteria bacterium]|nr:efflux RND transporter periplasmic adaptor subunit [Pseudomonadota bacterium]
MATASLSRLVAAPQGGEPALVLPALRADLQFSDGPLDANGYPTLIVTDPVRNAYFRIEWPAAAILQSWQAGPADRVIAALDVTFGLTVNPRALTGVLEFLINNELVRLERPEQWQALAGKNARARQNPLMRLAHSYLFFRIPLINPDRLLERVTGAMPALLSPAVMLIYAALVLAGAFLTLRQWDQFVAGAHGLMTLEALPAYAALLLGLKLVHECGHALAAKHFGCHVPSMGIAVMMGVPVFYTDTTDTWRLPERHKRLVVVLAGVGAEMLVAGIALLLWALAADGLVRQMALALITISLITSLTINLNPCMRFDGYFALSDVLGIANLQERSFRLTREHLRASLFGLPASRDRDLTARQRGILIVYGYATWLYRLVLYFGIAAMVYAASFKLLGIALFIFELAVFIVRPLWREAQEWWKHRKAIAGSSHTRLTVSLLAGLVILGLIPLNRVVEGPALLVAQEEAALHTRMPARLKAIHANAGDVVEAGAILFELESPALVAEGLKLRSERSALEARLTRAAALDADRDAALIIQSQLRAVIEKQQANERLKRDLMIVAPISGQLVDLDPMIRPGVWLNSDTPIARIASLNGSAVHAFISELDASRLSPHATAAFIGEAGLSAPVALRVTSLARAGDVLKLEPALAETFGGPVAVAADRKSLTPRRGMVHVLLQNDDGLATFAQRGTIRIAASAESTLWRALRNAVNVLRRESGF